MLSKYGEAMHTLQDSWSTRACPGSRIRAPASVAIPLMRRRLRLELPVRVPRCRADARPRGRGAGDGRGELSGAARLPADPGAQCGSRSRVGPLVPSSSIRACATKTREAGLVRRRRNRGYGVPAAAPACPTAREPVPSSMGRLEGAAADGRASTQHDAAPRSRRSSTRCSRAGWAASRWNPW